jgi:pimeloyl-ACP methyl ester carboxylesterase/quercetin dioxygenase-like cupin family protein
MPCLFASGRVGVRIEGSGQPVVLLHSSMSSKNQWSELIESLRGSFRLIAIDLLGYGDTAMSPAGAGYRLEDEVGLVEGVLSRELAPDEPFHLVGHSYGGVVALQLAAKVPTRRVRSLSLYEPIAFHLLPPDDPGLSRVEETWHEIEAWLDAGNARGGAARFVDYWSGAGAFAALRETRQSVLAALVPKMLLEFRAVATADSGVVAYREIQAPALLMAGRQSPEPAQRLTSILADILPRATCVKVAAGHMAPITHPDLVNPVLERFIRDVEAGRERERPVATLDPAPMMNTIFNARRLRAIAFGLLGATLSALPLFATQAGGKQYVVYPLEPQAWHQSPPGLPPGGTFAVVSGDPFAPGPFVMRVRLPPGFALPPYRRDSDEQLTVLAGEIAVGTVGESGAATTRTLTSGSFVSLPANEIHFANTPDGAVLQIIGMGPFQWGLV